MLIGITGAKGSGKGELAKLLENKGFVVFSMGDLVRSEAKKRGIELNKENLQELGALLSKEEGPNFVKRRILSKIERDKNYIVEGFRFTEDILPFKERKDFFLIGIIAPLRARWERISLRKRGDDNLSNFEEFKLYDESENNSSGQNVYQCLELADFVIVNEGSIKELEDKLEVILGKIRC